jgi:hypothetical protein
MPFLMPLQERASPLRVRFARIALRTFVPFLGVILMIAGMMGVVTFAVLPAFEALGSRNWEQVDARVESVVLLPPPSPIHPPLSLLKVAYRFERGGISYEGFHTDPHVGMNSWTRGSELVGRLKAAPVVSVWVNPADPSESMLYRELRWSVLMFSIPALALLMVGGIMVFAGMLSWNVARLPSRQVDTEPTD